MYIYLSDLVSYMLSSDDCYLNLTTGEFTKNLDEASVNCICIPKYEMSNEIAFLRQLSYVSAKRTLLRQIDNENFSSLFHSFVNEHGLYNDWIEYDNAQELEFARNWCAENNIHYTAKRKMNKYH